MTTSSESTSRGNDVEAGVTRGEDGPRPQTRGAGEPTQVGPYTLVDRIGGGGMGVVYRAHDPRLQRDLAIKLLRPGLLAGEGSDAARARLLREAQALARFSHPNVVQVFDVGTAGDNVWVAMELVEGTTLGRWLTAQRRGVPEILECFVAAGRGLAAAHAEGLVHRDFKPDNVFVGDDGRVRVGDFGIVRATANPDHDRERATAVPGDPDSDPAAPPSGDEAPEMGATSLTGAGLVLGTPAYMAPEQHLGRPTDPRTDQFAWCVALWEAVYGRRPHAARIPAQLCAQKLAGPPPRPADARVPARLYRALARGLSPSPAERWPGMDPLLYAVGPRGRRWVWGATLGGTAAIAIALAILTGAPDPCDSEAATAALGWDDARRTSIADAFEATSLPYAADTRTRVATTVDTWVASWHDTHARVCRATHVDGTQSQPDLDARMRCLDSRRVALDGFLSALQSADPEIVGAAVVGARRLAPPQTCETIDARTGGSPSTPDDPQLAAAVVALDADIVRHRAETVAGHHRDEVPRALALVQRAQSLGWDATLGRAELALAEAYHHQTRWAEALEHLERAWVPATASGDDEAAIDIAFSMVWIHGRELADADSVQTWVGHARAAIERRGSSPASQGHLALAQGGAASTLGDYERARRLYVQARELLSADDPDHPSVATALTAEGTILLALGEYEQARVRHNEALAIYRRQLGDRHPDVANGLDNLANAEGRLGRFDTAIALHEEAIEIRREALGPRHPDVAHALSNLAATLESAGQFDRAQTVGEQAVELATAELGDDHRYAAAARLNLASVLERQHQYDEAHKLLETSRRALADSLPADHPYLAFVDAGLGAVERARGNLDAARGHLAAAQASCAGGNVEPAVCHLVRLELARVRWAEDPSARAEALADASAALADLATTRHSLSGPHYAELEAWVRDAGGVVP